MSSLSAGNLADISEIHLKEDSKWDTVIPSVKEV